jgi:hypothetical protein
LEHIALDVTGFDEVLQGRCWLGKLQAATLQTGKSIQQQMRTMRSVFEHKDQFRSKNKLFNLQFAGM